MHKRWGVGVIGVLAAWTVWAGPTAEELTGWALQHWQAVGDGQLEQVLAGFAPEGALVFLGGPFDGFYYGADVRTGWQTFFAAIPVRGHRLVEVRAIPEAHLVYGTLELESAGDPVIVEAYLRFDPAGQILGADYVVVQGLLPFGPVADGVIGAGEYRHSLADPTIGMSIFWRNGVVVLLMAARSPGQGWISVAFDPDAPYHLGANIIIAAVTPEGLVIADHYGVDRVRHRADRRNDVLRASGTIVNGETVLEFVIPLNSFDEEDKPLVPGGTHRALLAYHSTATDFGVRHTARSTVQIVLDK